MAEVPLPVDIVMEILGYLSPSDIIRCRQVCRRWYQASKERTLWLGVLIRSQYIIPPGIDVISMQTLALEKMLLRAEMVHNIWSGSSAPLRVPRETHEGTLHPDTSVCVGLGPYVITRRSGGRKCWWYLLPNLENPAFVYNGPTPDQYVGNGPHIYVEDSTKTCFLAYFLAVGDMTGGEVTWQVLGVRPIIKDSAITLNTDIEKLFILEDCRKVIYLKFLDCHFIVVGYSSRRTNRFQGVLLHIITGRRLYLPSYRLNTRHLIGGFRQDMFSPFLTPSHYVRVVGKDVEFFEIPDMSESNTSEDAPVSLSPAYSGTLPKLFSEISIFPHSRSSYLMVGFGETTAPSEEKWKSGSIVSLLTLSLPPRQAGSQSNEPTRVSFDSIKSQGIMGNVSKLFFPCVSPLSSTALGVALMLKRVNYEHFPYFLSIRVVLDPVEPDLILVESKVPNVIDDISTQFYGVDPFSGQILTEFLDFFGEPPGTDRLVVINYVPKTFRISSTTRD